MLQGIRFVSRCSPSLCTSAPPLTVDNVLTAVKGVHWRTLGKVFLSFGFIGLKVSYPTLDKIGEQHLSSDDRLHAVVTTWIQGGRRDREPSWRLLIWTLDHIKMTSYADNIRHFAEPVLGKSYDSSLSTSCTVYITWDDTHASTPHINMCTTRHIETIVRIYSHLVNSHYTYSHCVYYYIIDLASSTSKLLCTHVYNPLSDVDIPI